MWELSVINKLVKEKELDPGRRKERQVPWQNFPRQPCLSSSEGCCTPVAVVSLSCSAPPYDDLHQNHRIPSIDPNY